jgi:hypothetical protein
MPVVALRAPLPPPPPPPTSSTRTQRTPSGFVHVDVPVAVNSCTSTAVRSSAASVTNTTALPESEILLPLLVLVRTVVRESVVPLAV